MEKYGKDRVVGVSSKTADGVSISLGTSGSVWEPPALSGWSGVI